MSPKNHSGCYTCTASFLQAAPDTWPMLLSNPETWWMLLCILMGHSNPYYIEVRHRDPPAWPSDLEGARTQSLPNISPWINLFSFPNCTRKRLGQWAVRWSSWQRARHLKEMAEYHSTQRERVECNTSTRLRLRRRQEDKESLRSSSAT